MSFASKDYTVGQLNAAIKKMKDQFGENAPMMFLQNKLELVWKSIFKLFSTFNLKAVPEHNTKECFQNSDGIKYWRDNDLDDWTPQERKAHEGGVYKAETLTERASFREIAIHVLNVEDENISNVELMRRLKEEEHTVEMKQIEDEIKRFEAGATDTSLAKDGSITFFFVENYDGSVLVVDVYWHRDLGGWDVAIRRFGRDYRWRPGRRVVSRNSENS